MLNPTEFEEDEGEVGRYWTQSEWQDWVKRRVDERRRIYLTDPDELISAYVRETVTAQDYRGRELLELLQNADDAGEGWEGECRAAIVLMNEGICIANRGVGFTAGGVKSLMLTHISPKRFHRTRHIGYKGLGFRSILSWTDHPFILSGDLEIAFSRKHAEKWLDELCAENPNVRKKVEQERKRSTSHPVPILASPIVGLSGPSIDSKLSFRTVYQKARSLRDQGYDTVIGLPFSDHQAYEDAAAQLTRIDRNVILFTRHLSKIELSHAGRERTWRIDRRKDPLEIEDPSGSFEHWTVFSKVAEIPREYLRADQLSTPVYELKLAVPREHMPLPRVLFSYFATQVRLPIPVVVHATVELTQNRMNLVDNPANAYVVDQMAAFLGEVARRCATPVEPWRALSILALEGHLDPVLEKFGFGEKLIAVARQLPIVPVRSGEPVLPGKARKLAAPAEDWLPLEEFEDIVPSPPTPSIRRLLEVLDIPPLTELRARLERISSRLTLEARTKLLVGLLQSDLLPPGPPPLLIDDTGALLPKDGSIFLPSSEDVSLPLPPWTHVRFLDGALAASLRRELRVHTQRDLAARLGAFNVREYALGQIVSAVNAAAWTRMRDEPTKKAEYRADLIRALFDLYTHAARKEQSPPPPDTRVYLPTRAGTEALASTLYLSAEYPHGRLTHELYNALPELLVASPSALGIQGRPSEVEKFLLWLGVAKLPRTMGFDSPPTSFLDHVKSRLQYPVEFGDFKAHDLEALENTWLESLSTVDRLDDILAKTDPHAVIAWLALDNRLDQWRRNGDEEARLCIRPPYKQKDRRLSDQTIPSLVTWRIETTAWVPTQNGDKAVPTRCTMDPKRPDGVQRILPVPALHPSHPILQALRVDGQGMRHAIERAGMRAALHDFGWDEFYDLLRELPRIDPQGHSARTLYRILFGRAENDEPEGPSCERFRNEGKLWGIQGSNCGYFDARVLYYDDNGMVPARIRNLLPIFQFDRRRGAQKVRRIFGVEPLRLEELTLIIDDAPPDPRAKELEREIDRLKPYIYVMRQFADVQGTGLGRLGKLDVRLCHHLRGRATLGKRQYPIDSSTPADVLMDGNTAYVIACTTETTRLLEDEVLADAVGEIFAAVFQIEGGGNFARLASCAEERRVPLLARVLGIDPVEAEARVTKASHELHLPLEGSSPRAAPWVEPPAHGEEKGRDPEVRAGQGPGEGASQAPSPPLGPPPAPMDSPGAVVAVAQSRPVLSPPRTIQLRVRATPRGPADRSSSPSERRITDPVRCQELAARFEEAEGQGRFPLPVDHLQGTDAYGCDILSFKSAADREQFRAQPRIDLVARFIEVKGRGDEHGHVELKGNELGAAKRFADKYFVYRVYDCGDGNCDIAILPNPIVGARDIVYDIDISRSPRMTLWRVTVVPGT
ncbi:DUF3883 domain-containing protein [Polyangium jinanense]|nr:DUF3883 domain-containing protein [Polyangium jinanense]